MPRENCLGRDELSLSRRSGRLTSHVQRLPRPAHELRFIALHVGRYFVVTREHAAGTNSQRVGPPIDKSGPRAFVGLQVDALLVEDAEHRLFRVDAGASEHASNGQIGQRRERLFEPFTHGIAFHDGKGFGLTPGVHVSRCGDATLILVPDTWMVAGNE